MNGEPFVTGSQYLTLNSTAVQLETVECVMFNDLGSASMNFTNLKSCPPVDSTLIFLIVGAVLFAVITALSIYYGRRFYFNSLMLSNTHIYNVVARYRSQSSYKNVDRKVNDRDDRSAAFERI